MIHARNSGLMIFTIAAIIVNRNFFFLVVFSFKIFPCKLDQAYFIKHSPLVYLRLAVWYKFRSYSPCSCVTAGAAAL